MIGEVLSFFPPSSYSLYLVSDPDEILADETISAALAERGFRLLIEHDPILLRYHFEQAKPFSAANPLIVVTPGALNQLPYDLWQQGHPVELALHRLFPLLDTPSIRPLTSEQRRRLAAAVQRLPPTRPLSSKHTLAFVLEQIFACTPAKLSSPAALLVWLADFHRQGQTLPPLYLDTLVKSWSANPALRALPLAPLLKDATVFQSYLQQLWEALVQDLQHAGTAPNDLRTLAEDPILHDALPRLLRNGLLQQVLVRETQSLPAWVIPGIAYDAQAVRQHRFGETLSAIEEKMAETDHHWQDWQSIARHWAQLTLWRYEPQFVLLAPHLERFALLQQQLDNRFSQWLLPSYPLLANRRLPDPHLLFHVPEYLAARRGSYARLALLVLDGMSLANWLQIRPYWQQRHPTWQMTERLLLAQIPSITAISRQALVSGLPPLRFASSLTHNRNEATLWRQFWQGKGMDERAIAYQRLPTYLDEQYRATLDHPHTRALCLITPIIDEMVHSATQGIGEVQRSLAFWLEQSEANPTSSIWLERVIESLLEAHYLVALSSDHGHVEALGMGQPQEGVTVESRSKRARIYEQPQFAESVQREYPDSTIWHEDGLLPPDRWIVLANQRHAFATPGQRVVTHGGLTLDEMIVPFIEIRPQSKRQ